MAGRRKIFQRSRNLLILQPRDLEILKYVFDYRLLSGKQIKDLCGFNCAKRANDRLRKLFDNGFLSRRLFLDAYKKHVLYLLGPKAAGTISSKTGLEPSDIEKKRLKTLKARDSFISHFLLINDFRYSLEMAQKSNPQVKIEIWKYKPPLFLTEEERVFPDAYLFFRHAGEASGCFLEVDRSVESRERIKKKIEFYLECGMSGCLEKRFGFRHFRLLIVAKTLMRLKSLLKIIEKTTDKSFCWLTIEKNIAPEKILSDIWFRPNKEGVFSL